MIHAYKGVAPVIDARTICVRPNITHVWIKESSFNNSRALTVHGNISISNDLRPILSAATPLRSFIPTIFACESSNGQKIDYFRDPGPKEVQNWDLTICDFGYDSRVVRGSSFFLTERRPANGFPFTEDAFDDVVTAWIDLTLNSAQDPKAGSWIAWMNPGVKLASTELWYGAPLASGSDSTGLAPFYNITAMSDTTKTRGHAAYVVDNESGNPYGLRQIFYDITVRASYEIASRSVDIFFEAIDDLSAVDGAFPVLIWQHITDGSLRGGLRNGGNAMGFKPTDGPIHIIQLACSRNDAADDDTVYKVMSDIMKQVKKESVELGVANDWVYMNYASQFQDVIASYGSESQAKLRAVAKKYDPKAVFQNLQPGYFQAGPGACSEHNLLLSLRAKALGNLEVE